MIPEERCHSWKQGIGLGGGLGRHYRSIYACDSLLVRLSHDAAKMLALMQSETCHGLAGGDIV